MKKFTVIVVAGLIITAAAFTLTPGSDAKQNIIVPDIGLENQKSRIIVPDIGLGNKAGTNIIVPDIG